MFGEKKLDAVEPSVDHCFHQSCSAFMILVIDIRAVGYQ